MLYVTFSQAFLKMASELILNMDLKKVGVCYSVQFLIPGNYVFPSVLYGLPEPLK